MQTRNVPCLTDASDQEITERTVEGEDGGWVETEVAGDSSEQPVHELAGPDAAQACAAAAPAPAVEESDDDDDDIEPEELGSVDYSKPALRDDDQAAVAPAAAAAATVAGTRAVRHYDITITYDVHYSTPRVWLFGYDQHNNPLKESEWRQDFSAEHVDKTVTYEQHPHLGYSCPSIHPCKHASAMVKMVALLGGQPLDIKYYMVIFLKFIQAMIPNMEYDYTSQFQVVDD